MSNTSSAAANRGFFHDFYMEYRMSMRIYLFLAVFISIFFIYNSRPSLPASFQTASLNEEESLDFDIGKYTGEGAEVFQSVAETLNIAIDPALMAGACALGSVLHEKGIWPAGIPSLPFGLFEHNWARILVLVWCLFSVTSGIVGGELKDFNTKYVGPFMLLAFEIGYILDNVSGTSALAADSGTMIAAVSGGNMVLLSAVEFVKLLGMYAVYLLVRVFIFGIDAILSIVGKLNPFLGVFFSSIKFSLISIFTSLSSSSPVLFVLVGILLIVLAGYFFRWAYLRIRFFRHIYLVPFLHSLFRRDRSIPPVSPRRPKWLKAMYPSETILFQIPVFSRSNVRGYKDYELWWMTVTSNGMFIDRRSLFPMGRAQENSNGNSKRNTNGDSNENYKGIKHVSLSENGFFNPAFLGSYPLSSRELYYRAPHGLLSSYCEIFSLLNMQQKPSSSNKIASFIFSREYAPSFVFAAQALHFGNYDDFTKVNNVYKKEVRKRKMKGFWKRL